MFDSIPKAFGSLAVIVLTLSLTAPTVAAQSGALEGTITWQYNDYVGTKGDVDAKVILFPEKLKRKVSVTDQSLMTEIGAGIIDPDGEAMGLRAAAADGYGKVIMDNVRPGHYRALIISGKTTRNVSEPITDDDVALLTSYFASKAALGKFKDSPFLKLHKFWIEPLDIKAGQTAHFNHDFGNTYL